LALSKQDVKYIVTSKIYKMHNFKVLNFRKEDIETLENVQKTATKILSALKMCLIVKD